MTPEDQRIAIAKACGKDVSKRVSWRSAWEGIPDYPNDLNAMQDAEATLGDLCWQFGGVLSSLAHPEPVMSAPAIWVYCCRATASQRAEAFLKTIGKWKD